MSEVKITPSSTELLGLYFDRELTFSLLVFKTFYSFKSKSGTQQSHILTSLTSKLRKRNASEQNKRRTVTLGKLNCACKHGKSLLQKLQIHFGLFGLATETTAKSTLDSLDMCCRCTLTCSLGGDVFFAPEFYSFSWSRSHLLLSSAWSRKDPSVQASPQLRNYESWLCQSCTCCAVRVRCWDKQSTLAGDQHPGHHHRSPPLPFYIYSWKGMFCQL